MFEPHTYVITKRKCKFLQGRNNRVGRVDKVQGAPSQGDPQGVRQKYRPNYFIVITIISTVPKNFRASTKTLMQSTLDRGLWGWAPYKPLNTTMLTRPP